MMTAVRIVFKVSIPDKYPQVGALIPDGENTAYMSLISQLDHCFTCVSGITWPSETTAIAAFFASCV